MFNGRYGGGAGGAPSPVDYGDMHTASQILSRFANFQYSN